MWKRLSQRDDHISQWPLTGVLDCYGYRLDTHETSLGITSSSEFSRKRGIWAEGQWDRVKPLFQATANGLYCSIHDVRIHLGTTRDRSLLWLYSRMNQHYYMACQNEGRCWRDIRAILDTDRANAIGHVSQRPKQQFRDSMTKTIELLEIAKDWLDRSLEDAKDQETFQKLKRKVEITQSYEKARIGQVLLNINDYQSEIQMELMVLQLEENRHAIQQAVSVGRLTKLAFLFVPLSTVCSAFGMNLREMDKHPTVWWFVGTSALCTLAAITISSTFTGRIVERTTGGLRLSKARNG
ncbi:hypothetical protein CC78DRAFT_149847 [Lojkania enalia]|uniref:Mg2+ transporter protein n=1 Tax=Lojkania enalia TaxID=147567 RepID=A0A9P4KES3_9PLEO|nr:hypothetical protein CC78DRAFT_149847 [Didymosphaeria enalia]